MHSITFAAVGTLVFNKRIRRGPLAVVHKLVLLLLTLLPLIFTYVRWIQPDVDRDGLDRLTDDARYVEKSWSWTGFRALGFEAIVTIVFALICWELNTNAQKKTT